MRSAVTLALRNRLFGQFLSLTRGGVPGLSRAGSEGGALLLGWFGVATVHALAVVALYKANSTLARHAAAVAFPTPSS